MSEPQSDTQVKRQEVAPGIFIEKFQEKVGDVNYYVLNSEVQIYQDFDLTIDFNGSQNVELVGSSGLVKEMVIPPFVKMEVARLILHKKWNMKTKFKFEMNLPSLEDQHNRLASHVTHLNSITLKSAEFCRLGLAEMKTEEIVQLLAKHKIEFVDFHFQPNEKTLVSQGDRVEEKYESLVHWRRAREAHLVPTKDNSLVPIFETEPTPEVVRNGKLNDGAIVSAIASLAEYPKLVHRLFISKKANTAGVFQVKLCFNGRWRTLVLDDFFPCFPLGTYMFSKSDLKELWVSLLEKAMAKKYEGYSQLINVSPVEALADLTGCPVFKVPLSSSEFQGESGQKALWRQLNEWKQSKFLVNAQAKDPVDDPDDLSAKKFTYSVIRCLEVPHSAYPVSGKSSSATSRLVQVRNLWGMLEWNGDWSADSHLWTEAIKQDFGIETSPDSLHTWMAVEDFISQFQWLIVSHTKRWHELRIKGKFVSGVDQNNNDISHFCSRWHYLIEIPERVRVVFGLHQEDERIPSVGPTRPFVDIGLAILRLQDDLLSIVDFHDTDFVRQDWLEVVLEPGTYIVLPRSTGICLDFEDNQKDVTAFSRDDPILVSVIEDIFEKYDLIANGFLSYDELSSFFNFIGKPLSSSDYQALIKSFRNGPFAIDFHHGISKEWFVRLFFDLIEGLRTHEVHSLLAKLGYKPNLVSNRTRLFTLSLHSDIFLNVTVKDSLSENSDFHFLRLLIQKHGVGISDHKSSADVQAMYYFNR
jgi:hypothetical protein